MKKNYAVKVKPHGLRPALAKWFENNPMDMLSPQDVADRWDVHIRYARNVLSILKNEGLIERTVCWKRVTIIKERK